MEEREIDLMDMLIEILLRWRIIIVCMLLLGILAGGFSYVKSYQVAQNQRNTEITDSGTSSEINNVDNLDSELLDSQILKVQEIVNMQKDYEVYRDYYEDSSLMQADYHCVPKTDIILSIVAEDAERAPAIAIMYGKLLNSTDMRKWIAERLDYKDAAYVGELIMIEVSGGLVSQSTGQVIQITVLEKEVQACKGLAQAVMQYVKDIDLTEVFGEYKLTEISNRCFEGFDMSVYNEQETIKKELFSKQRSIAEKAEALAEGGETNYYNFLMNIDADEDKVEQKEEQGEIVQPSVSKKYVLLGLVLGVLVCAFMIALAYIMNFRLRYTDDIANLYHTPELGRIPKSIQKRKLFGFIDKWILLLRNSGKRQFSTEEALRLAAVAVKMEALKGGFSTVFCVGCEMKKGSEDVCKELGDLLKDDGVSVECIDNVLYDAESLERLREVKAAVLVEKAGVAMYQELADEMALLNRQNIHVLGVIVVE